MGPQEPFDALDFDPSELISDIYRSALTWPLGRGGSQIVIVIGEATARGVATMLSADPAVDLDATTVIGVSGLCDIPPERLALEVRAAALPDPVVCFLALESEKAAVYAAGLSIALVEAGLPEAEYVPLGPDELLTLSVIFGEGPEDAGPQIDFARVFEGD